MARLTIPDVIDKFIAYYNKHPQSWGCLHIVLEEDNVHDDQVLFSRKWAEERGDIEAVELCDILLQMSKTQRSKIGRLQDKYFFEPVYWVPQRGEGGDV